MYGRLLGWGYVGRTRMRASQHECTAQNMVVSTMTRAAARVSGTRRRSRAPMRSSRYLVSTSTRPGRAPSNQTAASSGRSFADASTSLSAAARSRSIPTRSVLGTCRAPRRSCSGRRRRSRRGHRTSRIGGCSGAHESNGGVDDGGNRVRHCWRDDEGVEDRSHECVHCRTELHRVHALVRQRQEHGKNHPRDVVPLICTPPVGIPHSR